MTSFEILMMIGLLAVLAALTHILVRRPTTGSSWLAAGLSIAFAIYTALTLDRDGLAAFWTNHTSNLTGVQVWWDLLIATLLAFFFVAPRARAVGMRVGLWGIAVAATASIALLAMAARLFWLERAAERVGRSTTA